MAEFRFQNNEIQDKSYRTIGRIKGNEIQDASYRTIARVQGQNIQDASYRTIITVNDIKKEIEGANSIAPTYLAAIYMCFIKRGI